MSQKSITSYKVVVLVAIYKASIFIESKIQSLLSQTLFAESQIVLLNCQNLENEANIYAEFLNRNQNVIEIRYNQYVNIYKSWNDGIRITDSTYICNSNIDDQWHPEYLQRCTTFLDTHPEFGVVSSRVLCTDKPIQIWPNWQYYGNMPYHTYPYSSAGPCPMYRRSLHDTHGYYDERCQTIGDAIMWEKWLAGGTKFGLIPDELVLYYVSGCSLERRIDPNTGRPLRETDLRNIGRI